MPGATPISCETGPKKRFKRWLQVMVGQGVFPVDWSPLSHQALPGNYGKSLVAYFGGTVRTAFGAAASVDGRAPVSPAEMAKSRSEAEKRLRSLGYIR